MTRPIDKSKMYADLAVAFKGMADKENKTPRDFGYLGYEVIQNQYTVISYNRPERFYVTMKDGTFREIPHRGNVLPVPRLPVEIRYINDDPVTDRDGYIYGTNEAELPAFTKNPEAFSTIGLHSHHRGSGNEFPIDLRLIYQLKASISSGMTVVIQPGFYYTGDGLNWFPGASINLNANRPAEVSYKRWVVGGINPDTNEIVLANGTSQVSAIPLLESAIPSIAVTPSNIVYLFAVQLFQNRSALKEMDFVALYHIAQTKNGISDYKVKVSSDDTTPNFLAAKVVNGDNITVTVLNDGADETISINLSGVIPATALPNSGVTPGSYTNTDLTVDIYGRITAASNGSGGSVLGNPNPISVDTVLQSGRDIFYYARLKVNARFTINGRCTVIQ